MVSGTQDNLHLTRCNLMEPVYMEFDESFVMRGSLNLKS